MSELIDTEEAVIKVCEELKKNQFIGFDTEFIRETTFFPKLEIVQVSTEEKTWVIDVRAFKSERKKNPKELEPLREIFTNPEIIKVCHASQGDQECLYTAFGYVATPVLDTAIAASLCGYGEGMGLGALLKGVLGVKIKKGHARTNWGVRPLPAQLLEYAHADVEHLVALGKNLGESLKELSRFDWALELAKEFQDTAEFDSSAARIALKLTKGGRVDENAYPVLFDLVEWREYRVRVLNIPRRRVADDGVLLDLAHVKPLDLEHLKTFRGLNSGEIRSSGQKIIEVIQGAAKKPPFWPPEMKTMGVPSHQESRVIALVKCYLSLLADQHRISPKYLIDTDQLVHLVRLKMANPAVFIENGILSTYAAELIGDDLAKLLSGQKSLILKDTKVGLELHTVG